MKYMTFNSSCSYAGLANLLSFYGVDTEDRDIALRMGLPYLFDQEDGSYLSGPMLQGAKWFNLYLHPLGYTFSERPLGREEASSYLQTGRPAMLGLRVSLESRHAVIFTGWQDQKFQFINNKRKDSPEPETLSLTEEELLARLDETVTVGRLEQTVPVQVELQPYLEHSVQVVERLLLDVVDFCMTGQSVYALQKARDSLFRPILLDGVTMLELLGETEFSAALKEVRAQFMDVLRAGHSERLEDVLDMKKLTSSIAFYEYLIKERIKKDSI